MGIVEKRPITMELLFRLLLGAVFCGAAILKGMNPQAFQQEILAYQLIGYPLSFVVAHWLPAMEFAIGLGLLFRYGYRTALFLTLGLLTMFSIALTWTWIQGLDINCGCFGKIDPVHGQPMALLRDLILIAIVLFLYRRGAAASPN
jgi:putative oxidoreductase